MPIGRIVLKSISESKKLSQVKTDGARLLYTWLIPHLDINGCHSADPLIINNRIFTRLNKTLKDITTYLLDLQRVGLIIIYSANNDQFLIVPDFKEKQPKLHPDREAKPSIPLPTHDQLMSKSRVTHPQVKVNQSESKIKGKEKEGECKGETPEVAYATGKESWDKKMEKIREGIKQVGSGGKKVVGE